MCGWSSGFRAVHCLADDSPIHGELNAPPSREVNYVTEQSHQRPPQTRTSLWEAVLRATVLIGVILIAGRHSRRPDFLRRVREDCTAGDRWAYDLLDALSHPTPANDIQPPRTIKDEADAILGGAIGQGLPHGLGCLFVFPLLSICKSEPRPLNCCRHLMEHVGDQIAS